MKPLKEHLLEKAAHNTNGCIDNRHALCRMNGCIEGSPAHNEAADCSQHEAPESPPCEAEIVASSAHNNSFPENATHNRNALRHTNGCIDNRNALCHMNGCIESSPAHNEAADSSQHEAPESPPCEAEIVGSSAHNNSFPEKAAQNKNALRHTNGSIDNKNAQCHMNGCIEGSPAHNEAADSSQHEAPESLPCEAEIVASSAHNNSFPEKAAHNRNALCHMNGCIDNRNALCHVNGCIKGSEAAGHNEAANSSQHQLAPESPPCEAEIVASSGPPCEAAAHVEPADSRHDVRPSSGSQVHTQEVTAENNVHVDSRQSSTHVLEGIVYSWHGMQITLPAALRLSKWCTLEDKVLEFRGSDSTLKDGLLLLDAAALHVQYDIVDGALWLKLPSSQYSDVLPGPVAKQLVLWEKRNGLVDKYLASGSSGMIYNSHFAQLLIAECCIFDTELFARFKIADTNRGRVVPRDLQAEVAFECVSATDNVTEIWRKCERYISSSRAKMAVGICDRADKKEVMIAYRDFRGDVKSEVQQDPRSIDLGRVLRGFRIYFSYMIPTVFLHFTVHHMYDLRTMPDDSLQLYLCSQITQGGQVSNALAMEIVNGLGTVNFSDSTGRNPLVVALSAGNIEMVHFLLECKANPEFPDADNVCALLYAKAHNMQIYDAVKSASGRDLIISMGDLLNALEKNSPKSFEMILNMVLASGVDIDEINEDHGCTILSRAVSDERFLWAVSKLVNAGACPTKADAKGVVPLKKAVFSLSEDEVLESNILSATNMDMQLVRSMVVRGMFDDLPHILEFINNLLSE